MNINRIIFAIEDCISTLSRYSVSAFFPDYCDLHTVIGLDQQDRERRPWLKAPYIATTKQGYYLSVFEISGALKEMDENPDLTAPGTLESLITALAERMNTAYKNTGHKISFVFERDPERGRDEIEAMLLPQRKSIARTGILLQDVLDEKVTTLTPWLVRERCWLTVWSSEELLSRTDRKDHQTRIRKLAEHAPPARFAQDPWRWTLSALKIRHDAFLDTLEQALTHDSDGLLVRLMDIHEVGREIRRQLERNSTPAVWQPHLPEDARPAGWRQGEDTSVFHAPSLNLQLFTTQPETHGSLIKAGDLWHGMVAITLPPQNLRTFNQLVRDVPHAIPWRIRMDLMPGGMKALGVKKTLLTYSSFISPLRPMYDSVMMLNDINKHDPVCIMTIVATTWGNSREVCTRNQALLKSALEGWGVCGTTTTFGDPRRAWVNTVLAASHGSGPVPLYPPLSHALSLFPLNRAGSVWRG
ncbi:ATP-binding protein, partial [Escherichia coli]|nr:ATP-binding protein [Escherichia coli]